MVFRRLVVPLVLWALNAFSNLAAEPVRFLTWNVGLLDPWGVSVVPRVPERLAQLPDELLRRAADADVVVLQEVWRPAQARRLAEAFDPETWTVVAPGRPGLLGLGSGLLAAVRAPWQIEAFTFVPLGRNFGFEGAARKGILTLRITDGTRAFVLTVFHLAAVGASRGDRLTKAEAALWRGQLAQARTAAEDLGADVLPSVWAGDANAGPERFPELFADLEAAVRVPEPPAPGPTWDPENPTVAGGLFPRLPPSVIDHILFGPGWAEVPGRTVLRGSLSDHYALGARAELVGP